MDGRSAEETRGVSEEKSGVDAGAAGGTAAALGRDESSTGGRKNRSGGGPHSSQNSGANGLHNWLVYCLVILLTAILLSPQIVPGTMAM